MESGVGAAVGLTNWLGRRRTVEGALISPQKMRSHTLSSSSIVIIVDRRIWTSSAFGAQLSQIWHQNVRGVEDLDAVMKGSIVWMCRNPFPDHSQK
jgi:hypothetical protein